MQKSFIIVAILCIIAVIGITALYSTYIYSDDNEVKNAQVAGSQVYRIGVHEFPPLIIYNDGYENEPAGFDRDMIRWIGNEMGFDVEFILMAWSDAWIALAANEIDMILGGPSITPGRLERFLFSDPYLSISQSVVVSANSTTFMDDFYAGRGIVGVEGGTTSDDLVREILVDSGILPEKNLKKYDHIDMGIHDLMNGEIDFLLSDWPVMVSLVQVYPIHIIGNIDTGEQYGIPFNKENKELQQKVDMGLERLMDSLTWEQMKHKHLLDY
jgi:polar amino acid transport system substrate-binding protein